MHQVLGKDIVDEHDARGQGDGQNDKTGADQPEQKAFQYFQGGQGPDEGVQVMMPQEVVDDGREQGVNGRNTEQAEGDPRRAARWQEVSR